MELSCWPLKEQVAIIEWILLDYLIISLFFEFGAQDFIGLPLWCACVALAVQWKAVQCGEVQYSAVIVARLPYTIGNVNAFSEKAAESSSAG